MKLNLPKDFIWGTATAAHQVEGNNTNSDFWLLENTKNTVFSFCTDQDIDQLNDNDHYEINKGQFTTNNSYDNEYIVV